MSSTGKYRGKRVDNGEWVKGFLFHTDTAHFIIGAYTVHEYVFRTQPVSIEGWIKVSPETVGQCTGRHDRKRTKEYPYGQMIWQGDTIIATIYSDDKKIPTEVLWSDRDCAFTFDYDGEDCGYYVLGQFPGSIEVIGTIHDTSKEKPHE